MKGVVFTTFFDHVRETCGEDWLEDLIDDVDPPNAGAYTRVGTYPFDEMVSFVAAHCKRSGEPMPEVLERFGHFCFERWVKTIPEHFNGTSNLFDTLSRIDDFHENEVKKLYPDAELPSFKPVKRTGDRLELAYASCKPLSDLAVGVIRGAAQHYGEPVEIGQRREQGEAGETIIIEVQRAH